MTTETEFFVFLKGKNINFKLYDYVDGTTTDKYMENHPTVIKFRRFYENPFFWNLVLNEKKMQRAVDFFIDHYSQYADKVVISSIISSINRTNKDMIFNKVIKEQLLKSETKEDDMDSYMFSAIQSEKDKIFDDLIILAQELDIKPKYKTFGNVANCEGLLEIAKTGNKKFLEKLIQFGIDPELDESMSYVMALKHYYYKIGLMLYENGANIFTRNNLGLKLIEKNDQKKIKLSKENAEAREELLKLYENNKS